MISLIKTNSGEDGYYLFKGYSDKIYVTRKELKLFKDDLEEFLKKDIMGINVIGEDRPVKRK